MSETAIELATTLAYAQGGYTVDLQLGSEQSPARVVLDTGSSTLAVLPRVYDPTRDQARSSTAWAQDISYGGGAWAGPVLRSRLAFGQGKHARRIEDALFALIQSDTPMLRGADGILGLAYRDLNPAYDLSTLLAAQDVAPALTWPWPFPEGHALELARFKDFLHQQPRTTLRPAFSALENEGVVRNRFALTVGRAVVHVADAGASLPAQTADPLNRGVLVLGGGAAHQHLYTGGFQDVNIVHDHYYNANLLAVRVGGQDPIPVPPLASSDVASRYSNALLDTGSSFLVFESSVYSAVIAGFGRHDARLPERVDQFTQAYRDGRGLPDAAIDPRAWPDLHLHLEAPGGGETVLRVPASHYCPRNALSAGQSLFLLMAQLPDFPKQSVLGLPLFAGRYAVFDRSAAAAGVVRLATARRA